MSSRPVNRVLPSILIIFGILFAVLLLELAADHYVQSAGAGVYREPLAPAPVTGNPLEGIGENFYVNEEFRSHLPLVIIDTGDTEPPIHEVYNLMEDRNVPIPGIEPYVAGSIRLIDSGGMNSLSEAVSAESLVMIRRRGNSSLLYPKAQYLVKLVSESGANNDLDLLGLGSESEWILNGSMADKSLIRNYLAYRAGSRFMPFTPEAKYCEVLYREGGNYRYDGVFLLIQSIKQGPHRIDIPGYRIADPFPSYLVRRDRFDDNAVTLNTFLTNTGKTAKYLSLLYPPKAEVRPETVDYVEKDLNRVETVLYSDNESIFGAYSRYIDVTSFLDYFIFNEFFISYDAGIHSTYMYKTGGGKVKMGPVWDLDNALDNYRFEPANLSVTAFEQHPLFSRLVLDITFLKKLEARYEELRRGPLRTERIDADIDEIVNHLGPAVDREWRRWASVYDDDANAINVRNYVDPSGEIIIRNTRQYRQEIYRIKTSLFQHAERIPSFLRAIEWNCIFRTGIRGSMGIILLAVVIVFLIPLIFLARK